jgi:hypothetical protein
MGLNRILILGSDAAYYEYSLIALGSFLTHNPRWPALVMDVGLTPGQARDLGSVARVVRYPREEFKGSGVYIPSAKARCLALAEFPGDDTLLLYLDGDTVTLGSFEPVVKQFLSSRKPVGLAKEDDDRFWKDPAGRCWEGGTVPAVFPRGRRWYHRPMLNTGVLLAVGQTAAALGREAVALYEGLKPRFRFGEQTVINSVLYESGVGIFHIPTRYHCFLFDHHLTKTGRPYIDPVYVGGEEVVVRHFCATNKDVLDSLKQPLLDHYKAALGPRFRARSGQEAAAD